MTKKSIRLCYCHDCTCSLFDYGEIALGAYMTICEHYVDRGYALPVDKNDCARGTIEIVKFLELKGYVSSMEITKEDFAVKPSHYNYSKYVGHFFCRSPLDHFPDFVENN